jgi:hypothetical protein
MYHHHADMLCSLVPCLVLTVIPPLTLSQLPAASYQWMNSGGLALDSAHQVGCLMQCVQYTGAGQLLLF